MQLYFARHGQSEANVQRVFANGLHSYGLTALGRRQAAELADTLAGVRFAALYCSPILRAVQTAQIVGERLGLPYQIDDALREYDVGALEGLSDAASWAHYEEILASWLAGARWDEGTAGGESYNAIWARFRPLISRLEAAYEGAGAPLLLIGHGGLFTCMLPLLLANVDHAFCAANRIPNTGAIVATLRAGRWYGTSWCGQPLEAAP